ncbi:MAG: hypothetical protein M1825_005793 [Sarcosagium campestre]|nr:MAG: hypothetical protein M1825_005793 [Sarcosagium campestre]
MSAQIHFIDSRLSLIHIPLPLYPRFVQPILQLLFPSEEAPTKQSNGEQELESWASRHPFLNISITPVECSVVCARELAQELFLPVLNTVVGSPENVSITQDEYVVVQVDGEGLDAGQRVLELTSPLATAGISIFFITTYFSDYIIFPLKSRPTVVCALEQRGFVFERHADAFVNHATHRRHPSSSSSISSSLTSPGIVSHTPVNLQERTFNLLSRSHIQPRVDSTIRLIQCAGRKEPSLAARSITDAQLHLGLVKCLVHTPRFLSLTLTDTEPASLLLEKRLIDRFGKGEVLLGSKEDILIPITFDLRQLPLESTGIVCGVAGKLVGGTAAKEVGSEAASEASDWPRPLAVEMSYLSTARAGTVMVAEEELERAVAALNAD